MALKGSVIDRLGRGMDVHAALLEQRLLRSHDSVRQVDVPHRGVSKPPRVRRQPPTLATDACTEYVSVFN